MQDKKQNFRLIYGIYITSLQHNIPQKLLKLYPHLVMSLMEHHTKLKFFRKISLIGSLIDSIIINKYFALVSDKKDCFIY